MRYLISSLAADSTAAVTITLNRDTGTATYNSLTEPIVGNSVTIQGLSFVIDRVSTQQARGTFPYKVSCKLCSNFTQDYVCLYYPDLGDGSSYSISDLLTEIKMQSSITLTFSCADTEIQSFTFRGRVTDALNQLASDSNGIVAQQGNSWYILPDLDTLGAFTVEEKEIISFTREKQGDASARVLGLVSEYISVDRSITSTGEELKDLEKELRELEKELEDLKTQGVDSDGRPLLPTGLSANLAGEDGYLITDADGNLIDKDGNIYSVDSSDYRRNSDGTILTDENGFPIKTDAEDLVIYNSMIPMGTIGCQFGMVNNCQWQAIDSSIQVESMHWETWTPTNESVANPDNPGGDYWITRPVIEEDLWGVPKTTDDYEGLRDITMASILLEVDEPSNSSNLFMIKASRCDNFSGVLEQAWTYPDKVRRKETNKDGQVSNKLYFKFRPEAKTVSVKIIDPPPAMPDEGWPDGEAPPLETHTIQRQALPEDVTWPYVLDVQIRYLPTRLSGPPKIHYTGTVSNTYWPLVKDGKYVGYISPSGSVFNLSGENIWGIDISSFELTPEQIENEEEQIKYIHEIDCTVEDTRIVISNDGSLTGKFSNETFSSLAYGGIFAVQNSEVKTTLVKNEFTQAPIGEIYPLPIDVSWPGFSNDYTPMYAEAIITLISEPDGLSGDGLESPAEARLKEDIAAQKRRIAELEIDLDILVSRKVAIDTEVTDFGGSSLITKADSVITALENFDTEVEKQTDDYVWNGEARKLCVQSIQLAESSLASTLHSLSSGAKLCYYETRITFRYDNCLPLPINKLSKGGTDCGSITEVGLNLQAGTVSVTAKKRGG